MLPRCLRCGWRHECTWRIIVVIPVTVVLVEDVPSPAECAYIGLGRRKQHWRQHQRRIREDKRLRMRHTAITEGHAHDVGAQWALKAKEAAWHATARKLLAISIQPTWAATSHAAADLTERTQPHSAPQQLAMRRDTNHGARCTPGVVQITRPSRGVAQQRHPQSPQ